jgi:two-component system nitrate/nitrite response regulator NarL
MYNIKAMRSPGSEYEIAGEAEDALEAIRLIKNQKPDLVLLDLSMPRMNGFSVLREIKAALPEIKILVLSIHESPVRAAGVRSQGGRLRHQGLPTARSCG